MCCLAPKPTVKAPPQAINPAPGWPRPIPNARQMATGRIKMRSGRKDCAFQSKTKLSVRKWLAGAEEAADILAFLKYNQPSCRRVGTSIGYRGADPNCLRRLARPWNAIRQAGNPGRRL